jgi:hypothetical protein
MTRLQRAGVVLSVTWFFVGGCWNLISESNMASDLAATSPKICESVRDDQKSWKTPDHCWDSFKHDFDAFDPHPIASAVAFGLVPIPFGWLLVFLSIRIGRWVWRGRWKPEK